MPEQTERLVQCFASVFHALPPDRISEASIENVSGWDSLATVTLAALLEQEFGGRIDVFDLAELRSFISVREYLMKRNLLAD
jgi:acyl carrier protein